VLSRVAGFVREGRNTQRNRTRTVTPFPAIEIALSLSGMAPLSGDDPRHLGGFRVLTLLAVGGMGRVYLALGPDRQAVALKVARPEFAADARFRARFRREVATAQEVGGGGGESGDGDSADGGDGGSTRGGRGPGAALIAPVVAADPEAELPWLASEYVPGPSVTEAAMAFGPLGAAGLRTLTHGLALALTEVHAAGVVHRDVKPSNVLLARGGPRLIDFGVARALDDIGLTRVGALIGSPGFLSPEQAVGEPATFGSDVFALASVIAYAARGQSPFGAGDGPALLYRVVHEPPKLDGLPADLTDLLAACLAKDPAERPTAPEIAGQVAPEDPWLPDAVLDDIARREAELAAWLKVTAADPLWVRAVSAAFDKAADSALDIANAAVAEPAHRGTRRRRPRPADAAPGLDSPEDRSRRPDAASADARQGALDSASPPDSPAHGVRQPGLPRSAAAQAAAAFAAEPEHESRPEPEHESRPEPEHESRAEPEPTRELQPQPQPVPTTRPAAPTTRPGAAYAAFLLDPEPPTAAAPAPAAAHHRAPRRHRFPVYAALGALLGAAVTAAVLLLPHGGHGTPAPPQSPASSSVGGQRTDPSSHVGGWGGS
jgi:eukaryotic-like serine/threonine-protein kinase